MFWSVFDGFLVAKKKTEGFLILLQRYFYPDLKFYREIVGGGEGLDFGKNMLCLSI